LSSSDSNGEYGLSLPASEQQVDYLDDKAQMLAGFAYDGENCDQAVPYLEKCFEGDEDSDVRDMCKLALDRIEKYGNP